MKLFQKLLLAPTAIGLFAPIAASASEANLMDVSNYSQVDVEVTQDTFKPLSTKNPLLAGGEGLGQDLVNDFDGDTFSSTTSASFTANMAIGSVDGNANEEKVGTTFDWALSTVTSFTGNDSLDVTLNAGSGDDHLQELDFTESGDAVNVDSISYTSSLGQYLTYFFGFGTDGSYLYNTACAYEGQTEVLSKCALDQVGLDRGFGTNFGLSVDFGNDITAAFGYEGEGATEDGLLTEEGADGYGAQVSYIKDNWGISLTASHRENVSIDDDAAAPSQMYEVVGNERDVRAINAFFVPSLENFPSISLGYEWVDNNNPDLDDDQDEWTSYFIGVQFDNFGNGTLGGAVGSKEPTREDRDAETMYEVYYSYNYADGMTITPLFFVKEESTAGVDDETGMIIKTTFEF